MIKKEDGSKFVVLEKALTLEVYIKALQELQEEYASASIQPRIVMALDMQGTRCARVGSVELRYTEKRDIGGKQYNILPYVIVWPEYYDYVDSEVDKALKEARQTSVVPERLAYI